MVVQNMGSFAISTLVCFSMQSLCRYDAPNFRKYPYITFENEIFDTNLYPLDIEER